MFELDKRANMQKSKLQLLIFKITNQSPVEFPLQTLVRNLLNRIRYKMVNGRAHKSNFCVCTALEEQYLLLVFIRLHGKRLTIDVLLDVSPGFLASPSRPESGLEAARHCLGEKVDGFLDSCCGV